MTPASTFDPFAGLDDAPQADPARVRADLLKAARRGFVPLRKILVQKPNTEEVRAAKLAELVSGHHHRPFDALLLLHALEPILRDEPLDARIWARMLSVGTTCTPNAATKAFGTLIELNLVEREKDGRRTVLRPLHEGGRGDAWIKPGLDDQERGPGYFTLPHSYWTDGYAERLTLPGKAMLLIILAETTQLKRPTFVMPVDQARAWYGISERSAERGYSELKRHNLIDIHVQKVAASRHPAGRREVYHRALNGQFSTMARMQLQGKARKAVRSREAKVNAE